MLRALNLPLIAAVSTPNDVAWDKKRRRQCRLAGNSTVPEELPLAELSQPA
jgi:hypothetical protein